MTDDLAEFYAQLRRTVPEPRDLGHGVREFNGTWEALRLLLDHTEAMERRLLTLERAAGPWDERVRRLHPVTGAVMATVTPDNKGWCFTLYGPDSPAGWSMTGFASGDDAKAGADREMRSRGWALVGEP